MEFVKVHQSKDLPAYRRVLSEAPTGRSPSQILAEGFLPFADAQKDIAVLVEISDSAVALIASVTDEDEEIAHLIDVIRQRISTKMLTCYVVPQGYIRAVYEHRVDDFAFAPSEEDVWKKIHLILSDALRRRASDVFLFSSGIHCHVHYLVHRKKRWVEDLPNELGMEMARALFRHAPADAQQINFVINEPQETSLECIVDNVRLRLRYQHEPVDGGGVDVTLRLLRPNDDVVTTLEGLGYTERQIEVLGPIIAAPRSMLIMYGTTGSGKSLGLTSMVSMYDVHHHHQKHIRECSNPVEFQIPNVRASNIVTQSGASREEHQREFTKHARALLRMQLHALLLGEIRDRESALFAMDMALTGHKLFTTIHAEDAPALFKRLARWTENDPSFYQDGFIGAVIGQKLLPTLCDGCALPIHDSSDARHVALIPLLQRYAPNDAAHVRVTGTGCEKCNYGITGLAGSTVVAEVFIPTPAINEALEAGQTRRAQQLWRESPASLLGGVTYMDHALEHIFAGRIDPITASEELRSAAGGDLADIESYLRSRTPPVRSVS
jgi:general secretion pathway protein E